MCKISLYWFRKALRTHDNPALQKCLKLCTKNDERFAAIFILDPWFVKQARVGCNRWKFLQESLNVLNLKLKELGGRLYVLRGSPNTVFDKVFSEYEVTRLCYEIDTEPYALKRDQEVCKLARERNVHIIAEQSHTLYNIERSISLNGGAAPKTYQSFCNLMRKLGEPGEPIESPDVRVNCPDKFMDDENTSVPSSEELGIGDVELLYPGGEIEALSRLERLIDQKKEWIRKFEKPNTSPNSLRPSTTVLSPYLKFGCLSCRLFYHRLKEVYSGTKHSQPPVSLMGQLIWREFFYTVAYDTKNFDRMVGNPLCKQIPWSDDETKLLAWKKGQTGYPFIDAIMRQLKQEGWIHHLARHAVACFLTRGDLWISWEKGMHVFEEYLLDADWSLNAGNWLWLSASAFFHQYYRVYSPVAFGKKTDKTGSYIRKYVPEVKDFPTQYVYEPWKAPLGIQKMAKCIIGVDYPSPIVDHEKARQENIAKMSKAYKPNNMDSATGNRATKSKTRDGGVEEPAEKKSKNK